MAVTTADYLVAPPAPRPGAAPWRTLPDLFSEAVAAGADRCAVRDARRTWTWREWREESRSLAAGLQRLGVAAGDVVAVRLPNSWEFLTAHTAIADLGAVMLPLHAALGAREAAALLRRARARLLVTRADALAGLPGGVVGQVLLVGGPGPAGGRTDGRAAAAGAVHSYEAVVREHAGARPRQHRLTPDQPFVLLASSGTTSARPKLCLHSHGGLLDNALTVARDGGAGPGSPLISAAPFSHLFGLLTVHLALLTGAQQALLPHWDVAALHGLHAAGPGGPATLFAVPAHLRDLVRRPGPVRLREVRTGGAAVPADLVAETEGRLGARTVVQWGMSELGAGMYTRPEDPPEAAVRSIGRPVTGSAARVVAPDGTPCPDGETGELQFRGPQLFRGYLDDPEATRAALTPDGWLRTGDRASRNPDGTFAFRGRQAELINVGGLKFSASEVEGLLGALPAVRAQAVAARPDARLGEVPALVVALRPGAELGLDEVRAHLRGLGVAEYKWPLELLVVDEVPLTPTGKVARAALAALVAATPPEPAGGESAGGGSAGSPAGRLASLPMAERPRRARELVEDAVRRVTGTAGSAPGGPDTAFRDRGVGSFASVRMTGLLAAATGLPLAGTAAFDHPTERALTAHLLSLAEEAVTAAAPAPAPALTSAPAPAPAAEPADPVVITGVGCRFPGGVTSPDGLWRLLADGAETVAEFPEDRGWDLEALRHPGADHPGATPARRGHFLADPAGFDAGFFGIAPHEAAAMDPQQRLLLETAWEALERAGIDPAALRRPAPQPATPPGPPVQFGPTGVYIGMMGSDYAPRVTESPGSYDGVLLTGNAASVASGRLAYVLGLTGPALTVDTACSSSLVALHLARQALLRGECRLALAGGATVMSTPASFVDFGRQGALSGDGRCKAFAEEADGAGWGEGVAVLVLERLSDARRAGRVPLAVIAGSAVNQDGASNGLTAPSGSAQQQVIRLALADAGLSPADVDMVEAHGTGTPLGDRIEAGALLAAYGRDRAGGPPLAVGSVKSNIGHTQAAAGLAGVIKVVQAFRYEAMPRTLHADRPAAAVEEGGGVRLLREARPWPRGTRTRRAAVSAFGISGTNAHTVLQEPPGAAAVGARPSGPVPPHATGGAPAAPWVLSARTGPALRQAAAGLVRAGVAADPATARRLATGRALFEHRAVIVPGGADGPADGWPADGGLEDGLRAVAEGRWAPHVITGRARAQGRTVFVFPGQGSQWPGMAAELHAASPVFAESLDACERAFAPYQDWSVRDVLLGAPGAPPADRDDVAQTALFTVMVSLAAQWRSYGVRPDAVIGHSQGEIAAAYVAGALTLPQAAAVLARRAAMVRTLPAGAMAGVALSLADTADRLARSHGPGGGKPAVAAVNGPRSTVVAGDPAAVGELVAELTADGIKATVIPVRYASHTAAVEGLREPLTTALAAIRPRRARTGFYSTVTGARLDTGTSLTAEYWYENLRRPVEFERAVRAALADGCTAFVEVSPHPLLTHAVLETAEAAGAAGTAGTAVAAVPTLRRRDGGPHRFLLSAAEAFVHGVPVDWEPALPAARPGADAPELPTYPFQRQRYWLTPAGRPATAPGPVPGPASEPSAVPSAGAEAADPESLLDLVRALAGEVLGHRAGAGPSAEDDLFAAGMTSLSATRLRSRLALHLGVGLAATAVIDHPTPAALARYLSHRAASVPSPAGAREPDRDRDSRPEPSEPTELPDALSGLVHRAMADGRAEVALRLIGDAALLRPAFSAAERAAHLPRPVTLRAAGMDAAGSGAEHRGPVLVCLPSAMPAGGPHEYAALARALPGDHPVLALPNPGFRPGERLPADAEALLAAHADALARLGSGTPYVLCGHSSGGLLARSLAARLAGTGAPPAGLVLLDTFRDDEEFRSDLLPRYLRAALLRRSDRSDGTGSSDPGTTRLTAAGAYFRLLAALPPGRPVATPTLLVRAALPLPGTPPDQAPPRRHGADTVAVADGDHFTMMDAPQAASTAAAVGRWIAARWAPPPPRKR
ncbi:beta-ketoacyl synthase N-terminal-like domain-containing protein [Streptomyces sp. NPDC090022]|uniref:type I polyketide synthase n=1 Tax=Streptomyces sp. NPDC090022 TaxID=3365920 RepID=UPI00381CDFEC